MRVPLHLGIKDGIRQRMGKGEGDGLRKEWAGEEDFLYVLAGTGTVWMSVLARLRHKRRGESTTTGQGTKAGWREEQRGRFGWTMGWLEGLASRAGSASSQSKAEAKAKSSE